MEAKKRALEEEKRRRELLEKRLQEETSQRQKLIEKEVKIREKQRAQVGPSVWMGWSRLPPGGHFLKAVLVGKNTCSTHLFQNSLGTINKMTFSWEGTFTSTHLLEYI